MAPLVVTPAVATRWASSETDGRARWFEVVVTLPGVRSGADVHADVVHVHADRSVLSVLASATPGAGTAEGDPGVDYRADAPLPRECDTADGARVKFSKRSSTLTARFPERAAPAPPPQSRESTSAETSDLRGGLGGGGDDDGGGGGGGGDDDGDIDGSSGDAPVGDNPLAEYLEMLGASEMLGRSEDAAVERSEDAAVERRDAAEDSRAAAEGAAASPKTSPEETREAPPEHHPKTSPSEPEHRPKTSPSGTRSRSKPERPQKPSRAAAPRPRAAAPRLPRLRQIRTARTQRAASEMAEDLAASLSARGWATCDFITSDAVAICREEIKHVAPHYTPGEIWLGKRASGAQISVKSVRGDRVFWMHPEQIELGGFVALAEMLAAIDRLVLDELGAKRRVARLENLADRTHAMLAEYPGRGSRFVRHVDNTGRDGRRLTVLCYLNPEWRGENGGALKVYPQETEGGGRSAKSKSKGEGEQEQEGEGEGEGGPPRAETIAPAGGTLAMFYSDRVPHEVLPALSERHSFTVWYYDRDEHRAAVASRGGGADAEADAKTAHVPGVPGVVPGGVGGGVANGPENADLVGGSSSPSLSVADETAARDFVRLVMTERLGSESAVRAARRLSSAALDAAARVFGAPDGGTLLGSLGAMSREDFDELRGEMTSMGMGD
jgi:hypoxia-inducible factor (prolyl hydroxylase)